MAWVLFALVWGSCELTMWGISPRMWDTWSMSLSKEGSQYTTFSGRSLHIGHKLQYSCGVLGFGSSIASIPLCVRATETYVNGFCTAESPLVWEVGWDGSRLHEVLGFRVCIYSFVCACATELREWLLHCWEPSRLIMEVGWDCSRLHECSFGNHFCCHWRRCIAWLYVFDFIGLPVLVLNTTPQQDLWGSIFPHISAEDGGLVRHLVCKFQHDEAEGQHSWQPSCSLRLLSHSDATWVRNSKLNMHM